MIKDGSSKLVNVKNQSGVTKVLDMVPDFVEKFAGSSDKKKEDRSSDKNDDGDVVVS